MKTNHSTPLNREAELTELKNFISEPGSGLVYLRGRRRVGKSWILESLTKSNSNVFLFVGSKDASDEKHREKFAQLWAEFTGKSDLADLVSEKRTWLKIFNTITDYSSKSKIVLAFDEIQWIAKKGIGFVGLLKEFWVPWEKSRNVKVIICGSSNRFFSKTTGGEEKLLRGLQTRSSIWIRPFSPAQVRQSYFAKWSAQEAAFAYMLVGGIPYYLNQIPSKDGFVQGINKAFFLSESIFIEEASQILDLEFNSQGVKTAATLLRNLGQAGSTLASVVRKTGLSESLVKQTIDKLLEYQLVFEQPSFGAKKFNRSGVRFYMRDFFLNFYFQVLSGLEADIRRNSRGLLFDTVISGSNNSLFIPNFTGLAFELFVRILLTDYPNFNDVLFKKLLLSDHRYHVSSYWDKKRQIDIVVYHPVDKIERILECKWWSRTPKNASELSDTIERLNSHTPIVGKLIRKYLCTSIALPHSISEHLANEGIEVIDVVSDDSVTSNTP